MGCVQFQRDIDKRIDKFIEENKIRCLYLPEAVMPYREDWTYRVLKKLKPYLPKLI